MSRSKIHLSYNKVDEQRARRVSRETKHRRLTDDVESTSQVYERLVDEAGLAQVDPLNATTAQTAQLSALYRTAVRTASRA